MNKLVKNIFIVSVVAVASYGLQSCNSSVATPEEKVQIAAMDSTEKEVKASMINVEKRTKTLEEALEATGELFETEATVMPVDSAAPAYKAYGYDWNDDNFKDRLKSRSAELVTICYTPADGGTPATVSVAKNSLQAYLKSGATEGECKVVADNTATEAFQKERNDYYTAIEKAIDQLNYSKSILEYGKAKLATIKERFEREKQGGLDAAQFSQKQVSVKKLEDAVSALQSSVEYADEVLLGK